MNEIWEHRIDYCNAQQNIYTNPYIFNLKSEYCWDNELIGFSTRSSNWTPLSCVFSLNAYVSLH